MARCLLKTAGVFAASVVAFGIGYSTQAIADDDAVNSAIDWYEKAYAVSFIEGDADFYDHYLEPIYLGFSDTVGYQTKQSFEVALTDYVQKWIDDGWETSALNSVEGVEIDPNTVLLTARWLLKTSNGEIVTKCQNPGWRYMVVRDETTWRIISEFEAPCTADD